MPRKTHKERHEMTIDELIADSGWFHGTDRDWQALPLKEREEIAFRETGCLVAYATWEKPVDCLHLSCRIRRGELPQIALTNSILRGEYLNGWLTGTPRDRMAKIYRAFRKAARQTGIYDPWKLGWQAIVYTGVSNA